MPESSSNLEPAALGPCHAIGSLADRLHPAGLALFVRANSGEVLFADDGADAFFTAYVRRQLDVIPLNTGGDDPAICMPGIIVVSLLLSPRKQPSATALLVARCNVEPSDTEWFAACHRAGINPVAARQAITELPAYGPPALLRHRDALRAALADQLRLNDMQHELSDLSGQLANTYEELSLIYQISGGMKVNRRPADFFQQICTEAIDVMGVGGMGVSLPTSQKLGQIPQVFGRADWDSAIAHRLSTELLAWMRTHKTSLICNDLAKEPHWGWLRPNARRLLAVPLQRGNDVLGCLFAVDKQSGDFDSVDSKLLNSIANESAIFLENAVLFEDVHGLMMGLLHSLTSAVDAKDPYTCGHSERVATLSRAIASSLGLEDRQVERIYMAGLLHDVGKIGVPESVLQKPGRLTAEEFEQMKRHPAIGAKILQDVEQIQDIIPGVLHHHERYDGKGYPHGLAGKDIPLMGRIICMADCFDAMTSTRIYRKAMPLEVTLADLRRCSGTQFDPEVAEAFFEIEAGALQNIIHQSPINLVKPAISENTKINSRAA